MNSRRVTATWALGLFLAGLSLLPAHAEKEAMPDLVQVEQTCLPTSMTNLIVWFGQHGYPKLIAPGDSKANGYITTVHRIMADTEARFDWGTEPDKISSGVKKYIADAGYNCSVEFRGLGTPTAFSPEWLKENDEPNKGFVLLLMYCRFDPSTDVYTNAFEAGHAVTLVNSGSDFILVHDPAHESDEVGRKILTPEVITHGTWRARNGNAPVAGLMLLSGSLLDAPPESHVILIGAVCITMLPNQDVVASSSSGPGAGTASTIAGNGGGSAPKVPSAPVSTTKSWEEWLFSLLFSK